MRISGQVRQPRAWLNGITLLTCHVNLTRHQSASEAEATMALDDPSNPGAQYWSSATGIAATITATNGDGSGEGTIFQGQVDKVHVDFHTRIVEVHCLDNTMNLTTTRSDENFANQTPAGIVSQLAGQAGLGLSGGGGGAGGMAGKTFDQQNYAFNSDYESAWDVIVDMAKRTGNVAFVNGNTLFFGPPGSTEGSVTINYVPPTPESYASGNFMTLRCSRDVSLSGGVNSLVTSWMSNQKQPASGQGGS
jgi:hypothetical protein